LRPGTTEYAMNIMFHFGINPKLPLNDFNKLGNPEFPIPFSFIYGSHDWVQNLDEGASEILISEK
jgi:hypothetical protein